MNINNYVDKKYEKMSLKQLANAPVEAIQGISDNYAKTLKEAFKVKTISDLAKLKYVKWAQAICLLAEGETKAPLSYMNINKFVDKEYEKWSFNQLKDAPFDALQGVSETDSVLIKKVFRKKQLSKFAAIASAIVLLAEAEEQN
ncbi:MAG: hypothetical protein FWC21_02260 [Treponema sp.]|nr:hypothetical protein [Treponema sp.]